MLPNSWRDTFASGVRTKIFKLCSVQYRLFHAISSDIRVTVRLNYSANDKLYAAPRRRSAIWYASGTNNADGTGKVDEYSNEEDHRGRDF